MTARGDSVKAVLAGLGLAFGLGWLWFPWLAASWLPGLLWGDTASGGAGAFLLLLVLGFGLGGILCARILARKNAEGGTRRETPAANGRRLCHAAAYTLLLAALLLRLDGPRNMPGIWPYFAMPAVVAAYAAMGLYWGGRILSLAPALSALAFFAAAVAAAVAGPALSLLSMRTNLILWPHGVAIAAMLAEILARTEAPQPKSRGRPPKKEPEAAGSPLCFCEKESPAAPRFALAALAAVLASVGFADGAAWALYAGRIATPPAWLAGLCLAAGAFVPLSLIARFADPRTRGAAAALVAALGTAAAALGPSWGGIAGGLPQYFVEGVASALGLCLLADGNAGLETAVRRAGLALAACVVAMNAGRLAGGLAADATGAFLAAIPAAAACAALFWMPFGAALRKIASGDAKRSSPPGASASGEEGAFPGGADGFLARFTDEEARIVKLLSREGLSNQEIANRLFVTRSTVRYHLKKIYAKTDTSNREELLDFVVRNTRLPGKNGGDPP